MKSSRNNCHFAFHWQQRESPQRLQVTAAEPPSTRGLFPWLILMGQLSWLFVGAHLLSRGWILSSSAKDILMFMRTYQHGRKLLLPSTTRFHPLLISFWLVISFCFQFLLELVVAYHFSSRCFVSGKTVSPWRLVACSPLQVPIHCAKRSEDKALNLWKLSQYRTFMIQTCKETYHVPSFLDW